MYIMLSMVTRARDEGRIASSRRTSAQMTKAWKILRHLREQFSGVDDLLIKETIQLWDDGDWDRLRIALTIKPTSSSTTCTVSREVKAIVLAKLGSNGRERPAAAGVDVMRPRPLPPPLNCA
jgi:hypothetical protein